MSAIASLVFIATITPGPNNLVLLHNGITRPFATAVPLLLGIIVGGSIVLLLVFAMMRLAGLALQPMLPWLSIPGACFLAFMAWNQWTAPPAAVGDATASAQPGFWSMTGLQLVNPKGWAFLASLVALQSAGTTDMAATIALFAVISLVCSLLWLASGRLLQRFFASPRSARLLNRVMATLLLAMVPLLILQTWNS